jgi:aspartyl-tRNA(Asn)/glutamyl-tRNA(Gln) amidotransferase subunit A
VEKKDYSAGLTGDLPSSSLARAREGEGLRLGVPEEYFVEGMEEGTRRAVQSAIQVLEGLGATIEPVSLPTTRYALACYYIIAPSECSANLARYDGVKYGYGYRGGESMWEDMEGTRQHGFGPEVRRRIMLGTYALSAGYYDAYYLKAQQVRTLIRQDFQRIFERVDALVTPTSPVVAFRLGDRTADPVQMYLIDVCTLPVNIAGLPAMSVPCGFDQGLPVGMQLIGPHLSEETLLRVAYAYQRATSWHQASPNL